MIDTPGWGIALRLGATFALAAAEARVGQVVFHRSAWALAPVLLYLGLRRPRAGDRHTDRRRRRAAERGHHHRRQG